MSEVQNRGGDSTSPGLSSPPSPNSPTHQTAAPNSLGGQANTASSPRNAANVGTVGGEKSARQIGAKNASVGRKPRRKKDADSAIANNGNASTATDGQDAKPKKARAPRGTSAQFKKKQQQKLLEEQQAKAAEAQQVPRQPKITESIRQPSLPPTSFGVPAIHVPAQNGNNEAIPPSHIPSHNIPQNSRTTSGQNYDPIRSSTVVPRPSSPMGPIATTSTPTKAYKYSSASASPSISSLIDPPSSMPPYQFPQSAKRDNDHNASSPPKPKRPRLSPPLPIQTQHQPKLTSRDIPPAANDFPKQNLLTAMEVDTEPTDAAPAKTSTITTTIVKKPTPNASTAVSSSSHSPKLSRPKEAPVTLPSGSGLLSGSIFGSGIDSAGPEKTAPTVVLNVRLDGDNQYVNFTRLAEERYGFNALHPRLAAQRERLARVAAAGAALENAHKNGGNSGSGDEMSVDLSGAEAEDSNVEMGGMNDGERILGVKSGGEGGEASEAGLVKKPRKRMMKEDMYDKEDEFIDDTELIWEEQAATSKDGFFVYSGPLVPEGEEAKVERYVSPLSHHVAAH